MSSSVIVLRVELEPSGVSLVLSQGFSVPRYTSYLPPSKLPFSAPPYTWGWGTGAPREVHSTYLHSPLERRTKGIGGSAGNGQNFFVRAEVCCSLLWKGATQTCCAFLLLPSPLARKVNKGGTVPPRAPLCTEGYIHLVLPSSNLSTLQLLCPCELVLQPPWICFAMSFCQKGKLFP